MGAWGEDLIAQWYEDHGYLVVQRNWRCRQGEIDIIASRDQILVICEVKTRATADFGSPALAVNAAKQQRLRRLAGQWLAEHPGAREGIRFDVGVVIGSTLQASVEVIESAF